MAAIIGERVWRVARRLRSPKGGEVTSIGIVMPAGHPDRSGEVDETVHVLLVDPSPLSRSCLLAGFSENPEIAVIACGHVEELGEGPLPNGEPSVVMLQTAGQDVQSREFGERLRALTIRFPGAATMLLSAPEDVGQMLAALRQGVGAYITSGIGVAPTIAAIRLMRDGLIVYPRDMLSAISVSGGSAAKGSDIVSDLAPRPGDELLTPRQLDVLRLLARGLSNKAIASELDISESTVKVHIRAIMERTGMLNRTQIVAHFFRPGFDRH
jgi:DNA-binding NarL/FixJ family response regulator